MYVSVIIPCYNEASRGVDEDSFLSRLERLHTYLGGDAFEVKFVDDGSTDNTLREILDFIQYKNARNWSVISSQRNYGKGHAIKMGIDVVRGSYTLIMDADLSVPLEYVNEFIAKVNNNTCILASRHSADSIIVNKRKLSRRLISWLSQIAIGVFFGLGVDDTQCGFKLFPTEKLKQSTSYVARGWLYDIELLMCMKYQGVVLQTIPVEWRNMENESTLSPIKAVLHSLKDLNILLKSRSSIKSKYST